MFTLSEHKLQAQQTHFSLSFRGEGRSRNVFIMLENTLSDALRGNHVTNHCENFRDPPDPPVSNSLFKCGHLSSNISFTRCARAGGGRWMTERERWRERRQRRGEKDSERVSGMPLLPPIACVLPACRSVVTCNMGAMKTMVLLNKAALV